MYMSELDRQIWMNRKIIHNDVMHDYSFMHKAAVDKAKRDNDEFWMIQLKALDEVLDAKDALIQFLDMQLSNIVFR